MAICPSQAIGRKIQVLVADDHSIIRKKVRAVLESHSGFEVCGEVGDGAEAVEEAVRLKPDVVVLNVMMPVLNGFEAACEIKSKLPDSAIVILSSNADKHFVEEARKVGTRAYVAKTRVGQALIKAIADAVESGDFILVSWRCNHSDLSQIHASWIVNHTSGECFTALPF